MHRKAIEGLALACVALALIGTSCGLAWKAAAAGGPTFDEVSHLPAGYSYVRDGKITLNPQHPPLVKRLAGASVWLWRKDLAMDRRFLDGTPPPPKPGELAPEWEFGRRFLFDQPDDRDHAMAGEILRRGRLPNVIGFALLQALVFLWSRSLFGNLGGLVSLALSAVCPNLIAHSALVTFDAPLATAYLGAVYAFWRWVERPGAVRLVIAGAALGIALAVKFSAVFLFPTLAALLALQAWRGGRGTWVRWSLGALGAGAVAALVLWACYGFPRDPGFYLDGLRRVNADHNPDMRGYLQGKFFKGTDWSYFLVALAVKVPLGSLVVLQLALVGLVLRRHSPVREAFLLLPPLVFLGAMTFLSDPMGVRYVIPILPFLFVFAGRVAWSFPRGHWWGAACLAILVWSGVSTWRQSPHFLGIFNELAGGTERGDEWLDDSNLDWGGGLPALRSWLDARQIEQVHLFWPWTSVPASYYLKSPTEHSPQDWFFLDPVPPGIYVASKHWVVRMKQIQESEGLRSAAFPPQVQLEANLPFGFFVYRSSPSR
jgi:MFS family permease